MPEVSVIIPFYKKADTISRCLRSVSAQTFIDFEVVIVHRTSENVLTIEQEVKNTSLDGRIILVEQEGTGVSSARNQGVLASTGPLISFIDADDEWSIDHLETLVRLREEYPGAGLFATACRISDGVKVTDADYSPYLPRAPWEGIVENYWKISAKKFFPPVATSYVAMPRRIFEEMRGFNTMMTKGEDIDLWGRVALRYPVVFSWRGIGIYHTEDENRLTLVDKRPREVPSGVSVSAWEALQRGEVPSDLINDLEERVDEIQIAFAWINLKAGRPDLARRNIMDNRTRVRWWRSYWALIWTYVPSVIFISLYHSLSRLFN